MTTRVHSFELLKNTLSTSESQAVNRQRLATRSAVCIFCTESYRQLLRKALSTSPACLPQPLASCCFPLHVRLSMSARSGSIRLFYMGHCRVPVATFASAIAVLDLLQEWEVAVDVGLRRFVGPKLTSSRHSSGTGRVNMGCYRQNGSEEVCEALCSCWGWDMGCYRQNGVRGGVRDFM
jgi:hypothetical protein